MDTGEQDVDKHGPCMEYIWQGCATCTMKCWEGVTKFEDTEVLRG